MSKKENDKINFQLDEVISPIFGDDYKDRIIKSHNNNTKNHSKVDCLEQHIEREIFKNDKINKNKQYQTKVANDDDILVQYKKNKSKQEIIESLPSNYLDFRDNLLQSDRNLTIIDSSSSDNTISQIINDILDKNKED